MTINNSTFLEGGTISATGGTSKTVVSKGGTTTKQEFYVDEDSVASTRRYVTATATPSRAQASAPGGMTQERYTLGMKRGKQLSNSNWTTNNALFELRIDPETTDAERLAMRDELVQIILGADDLFLKGNAS